MPKKNMITSKDLYRFKMVTSISMAPDETRLACTLERIDEKEQKYFSNIWMLDLKSGAQRQFTFGDQSDGRPHWSPDGRQLAFVSTRNKKTGIYVIPASGGAERRVIELDASIGTLLWSPDGMELVFALRYNDSHFIADEKKKKEAPVFRHVKRLFYRLDGEGFIPKDRYQIYRLTLSTGKLTKLTKGKRDNFAPALSSDGKWIAYVSNRSKDPDLDLLRDDVFIIPARGGRERKLATPAGPKMTLSFSPDGRRLAYVGHDDPNDAWGVKNAHVWVMPLKSQGSPKDILKGFDRMAYDDSIADLEDVHGNAVIQWSRDGRKIFFLSSDTGTTGLYSISTNGGSPVPIFTGRCHIKRFDLSESTRVVGVVHADLRNPGDVWVCPAVKGGAKRAKRLTTLNPFLRSDLELGETKDVRFSSFDGTKVQGFLVTPPHFDPRKKYPAILEIHGGPRAQYAHTFFHEMQLLAARGYIVFYTNPRGGSGRGEAWAASIAGGWGDVDYKDCMAAADYLEQLPYARRDRIGVTGGSYGGYMTNWIIGHTNRFRAAVTQRSVVELISFFGSSDIGWSLEREFAGWPWKNKANYEKCSPLNYLENVKTPLLILHNEKDLRCNIEQAEQLFTKLKVLGKRVEFVRFPDEPHGMSRHGRPDRRIARLGWIVRWFDRYLKR